MYVIHWHQDLRTQKNVCMFHLHGHVIAACYQRAINWVYLVLGRMLVLAFASILWCVKQNSGRAKVRDPPVRGWAESGGQSGAEVWPCRSLCSKQRWLALPLLCCHCSWGVALLLSFQHWWRARPRELGVPGSGRSPSVGTGEYWALWWRPSICHSLWGICRILCCFCTCRYIEDKNKSLQKLN